jgi:hypothetical protein
MPEGYLDFADHPYDFELAPGRDPPGEVFERGEVKFKPTTVSETPSRCFAASKRRSSFRFRRWAVSFGGDPRHSAMGTMTAVGRRIRWINLDVAIRRFSVRRVVGQESGLDGRTLWTARAPLASIPHVRGCRNSPSEKIRAVRVKYRTLPPRAHPDALPFPIRQGQIRALAHR